MADLLLFLFWFPVKDQNFASCRILLLWYRKIFTFPYHKKTPPGQTPERRKITILSRYHSHSWSLTHSVRYRLSSISGPDNGRDTVCAYSPADLGQPLGSEFCSYTLTPHTRRRLSERPVSAYYSPSSHFTLYDILSYSAHCGCCYLI